jgi:hypothetical protein
VHTIYILDMTEKDNLGDLDVDINIWHNVTGRSLRGLDTSG